MPIGAALARSIGNGIDWAGNVRTSELLVGRNRKINEERKLIQAHRVHPADR